MPKAETGILTRLFSGAINVFTRQPKRFEISTPFVNGTVEGTEFAVLVDAPDKPADGEAIDGHAEFSLFTGALKLGGKETAESTYDRPIAVAVPGVCQAPTAQWKPATCTPAGAPEVIALDVLPQDRVQWSLYYPEPLAALARTPAVSAGSENDTVTRAVALIDWQDVPGSIGRLTEAIAASGASADERDALRLARASAHLRVGNPEAAAADLAAIGPESNLAADAAALKAIIAVVSAQPDSIIAGARTELEAAIPQARSAAPWIALSYVHQASRDLASARQTMETAVERYPNDPLAWTRLAELWLSFGGTVEAAEAIGRALALNNDRHRVRTVAGFVRLSSLDIDEAIGLFRGVIAENSSDPLPRFGLGLALIRKGRIEDGRTYLAEAAAMSPGRAIFRSYLGKSYSDAHRPALAREQFVEAKRLDPHDPTAYQFNALQLQGQNRPVEALRELEKSIELNDNRGIYRDRASLATDQSVRGANLGRVFTDLGFDARAIQEGARSITKDPSNYAGHQFLAEAYDVRRRHELARSSEILQGQMLSPLQRQPVDISRLQTDLNILPGFGPARSSFNEFTPLFESKGVGFWGTGFVGTQETIGDQIAVSGMADRFSVSASQFHYQDDGFRPNSDIKHDLANAFGQFEVAPWLTLQGEVRVRRSEEGDRALRFDPSISFPQRSKDERDIARFGMRISPSHNLDILTNTVYGDRDASGSSSFGVLVPPFGTPSATQVTDFSIDNSINGWSNQAVAIWLQTKFNLVAGITIDNLVSRNTTDTKTTVSYLTLPFGPNVTTAHDVLRQNVDQYAGFGYIDVSYPESVEWTLGVSVDSIDSHDISVSRANPKLGVRWDAFDWLSLRAAYFQTVTPLRIASQTLEPTQVAGFNQFFDEPTGTKSERYGAGIDVTPMPSVSLTFEATRRHIDLPIVRPATAGVDFSPGPTFPGQPRQTVFNKQHETEISGFLNWTPTNYLAASVGISYELFKQDQISTNTPGRVETLAVPVEFRGFHPSGLFGAVGADFVHQTSDVMPVPSSIVEQSDDFALVNLSVGYRLPDRRGIIALEVQNLFDSDINFYDDTFRSIESSTSQYSPERRILLRGTLRF